MSDMNKWHLLTLATQSIRKKHIDRLRFTLSDQFPALGINYLTQGKEDLDKISFLYYEGLIDMLGDKLLQQIESDLCIDFGYVLSDAFGMDWYFRRKHHTEQNDVEFAVAKNHRIWVLLSPIEISKPSIAGFDVGETPDLSDYFLETFENVNAHLSE